MLIPNESLAAYSFWGVSLVGIIPSGGEHPHSKQVFVKPGRHQLTAIRPKNLGQEESLWLACAVGCCHPTFNRKVDEFTNNDLKIPTRFSLVFPLPSWGFRIVPINTSLKPSSVWKYKPPEGDKKRYRDTFRPTSN